LKSIVYTFGRFNPPTKGHERLVSTVVETAKKIGGEHIVYLSQTQNGSTDPLDWSFKRRVCESAFKGVNISKDLTIKNPYLALEHLKENYDKVVLVAGSDQVDEYIKRFSGYADNWGIQFEVVSAGQRIVEAEGVEGISATKMRQFARDNNIEKFLEGLPTLLNEQIKKMVLKNTQKGLKKTK
jgi:hypothetical protein